MSTATAPTRATPPPAAGDAPARRRIVATPGAWLVWGGVAIFLLLLLGVVTSVLVNSFGTQWFETWLPRGWTTQWYAQAWNDFDLLPVIVTTLEVAVAVVALSVLVGAPASYVLARRAFPGKRLVSFLFLLPIMMPPITYGIPLATVLYRVQLAGSLPGVILANLVPTVPFVVLIMIPFIEQIDPKIEAAARMCGASTLTIFMRILGPLMIPGILAAAILVLVRTVGMFELTFLTSGPSSQTIVVVLYDAVFGAGIRATQEVDAMAIIYTASMMLLLVIALRFVNPTQLVTRVGDR